ncbi:MAG: VCBS repeat-containing protein [Anaerolineales bacterium]|nr:VCBS repeat-containing protein [Anaerolineales bacterium]
MNHKSLLVAAVFLVLFGCGGSGGGSGGNSGGGNNPPVNPPTPPVTPGLQQTAITRGNAVPLMDTSFALMNLSRNVMYDFPYLANYVLYYAEDGRFYEESACDNPDGAVSISGDISVNDATGEILYTYDKCVDNQFGIRSDGIIRVTIDQTDLVAFPIIYTVSFEDFETTSPNGSSGSVINGTIDVDSPSGIGQTVTSDIKVEDINSGIYIKAYGLTVESGIAVGDYPYAEYTKVAGTVGHSELGKVVLSSEFSIMDYMKIAGKQDTGVRVSFLDEDKFIASLDDDGDWVPNAYMSATVSGLSENPGTNDAPVAAMDDSIEALSCDAVVVSLREVTDPDCDFLDYSVDLIESPPGSRFDWSIDGDLNLVIFVDEAGIYIFDLVADDGYGGVLRKQITLQILLNPPQVDLPQTFFQYTTGDLVAIDVSPTNMDQGPFTYSLSPPIPAMTIDSSGILQWQVPALDYFPQATIETVLSVSNAVTEVEMPLNFSITDPGINPPIARSGIEVPDRERNIHVGDFDDDGVTEILLTDNRNLIYTLEWDNGTYVQDWLYPYEIRSPGDSIDAILPLDLDGDGKFTIYVQTGSQIKAINGNTVTASMDVSEHTAGEIVGGWGMAAADLDNDGKVELAALFDADNMDRVACVIDAESFDLVWQTPILDLGRALAIGNVDNDSALELVFAGGYVYDGATHSNEWAFSDAFGSDIVVADIEGDGVEEIIADRRWETPAVYDAVKKTLLFYLTDESDVCSVAAANLDADPQKEILIGDCQWGDVSAYDADSGSAAEIWSVSSQDHGAESLAVGDTDQDGNLEVIWGTGLSSSGEDSLVVFDALNQAIDFRNTNPSQLDGPYIGGISIENDNGNSRVVFAVPTTDSGYAGSRLLSMNFDTGNVEVSSEVGSNWSGNFDFCIADYDSDGTEEVLFSSSELYTGFVSAYDLFSLTGEWSVTGSYNTAGDVACGDINGDGHADLAAVWGASIRLYDPFNRTLLWSSSQLTDAPIRIEIHDLDGDTVPEIIALSRSDLVVYSRNGSGYSEERISYPAMDEGALYIEDINGDHAVEIIVSKNENYFSETSDIVVLDKNLNVKRSFSVRGRVSAMTSTGSRDDTLLIGETYEHAFTEYVTRIKLINLQNGHTIWNSPPILGGVSKDSLHTVQKPGSSKKRLAVGTNDAMYITQ